MTVNYLTQGAVSLILAKIPYMILTIVLQACTNSAGPPANELSVISGEKTLSESTEGLDIAQSPIKVDLKDGDKFTLRVTPMKRQIQNRWLRLLAVNGSVPGPLIRVKQGATLFVNLVNATDIPLTLHSHGVRVAVEHDGAISHDGRGIVQPGAERLYTLHFPDAGVFWYHSHVREDYTLDHALYGNFLVEPAGDAVYSHVDREEALILDDLPLHNRTPYYTDRVTHTLMGRYGDVPLINGSDDFVLSVKRGELLRLFLTNTANARTIAVSIPGVKLKLVGGDNGLYERESWVDQVLISPSERAIVELRFDQSGTFAVVNNNPWGRTMFGKILVTEDGLNSISPNFGDLRPPSFGSSSLDEVRRHLNASVKYELEIGISMRNNVMQAVPVDDHGKGRGQRLAQKMKAAPANVRRIEWDDHMPIMNRASDNRGVTWSLIDRKSGRENMDINLQFKKGEFAKIRIVNPSDGMHPMAHPIHFHGQRFIVAAVNGKTNDNLVWKDTVLITPGETTDLILEATNPGHWMAHCHIAEHLASGMMIGFSVN